MLWRQAGSVPLAASISIARLSSTWLRTGSLPDWRHQGATRHRAHLRDGRPRTGHPAVTFEALSNVASALTPLSKTIGGGRAPPGTTPKLGGAGPSPASDRILLYADARRTRWLAYPSDWLQHSTRSRMVFGRKTTCRRIVNLVAEELAGNGPCYSVARPFSGEFPAYPGTPSDCR